MRLNPPTVNKFSRYGWNYHVIGQEKYDQIIQQEGLIYVERPDLPSAGMYFERRRFSIIAIHSVIHGAFKQFVQRHELGHFLLHSPRCRYFRFGNEDKIEEQAHLFAACAMLPLALLKTKTEAEIQAELTCPQWLWDLRLRTYRKFKL